MGTTTFVELTLIRHGESTGNVARQAALRTGAEIMDIPERDPDIPLSARGREQAARLGQWLAAEEPFTLVLSSPYRRALETVTLATGRTDILLDERLRDRDMGAFQRLTPEGIRVRHPQEWERERELGKFYYRPPGGESWADIALRLRSALAELPRDGRVLISTHDAVILLVGYLMERLTEAELMELQRVPVENCSVCRWRDGERLIFNQVSPPA